MSAAPLIVSAPRPELLSGLGELATRAAAFDLDAADGDRAATERAASALRHLVEDALELMAGLERVDDSGDTGETLVVDLEVVEPDAWLAPQPHASGGPRVGDVCFAGRMELKRVLRELDAAYNDEGRLVAAETMRRKLRRVVRAVLETARAAGVYDAFAGDSPAHLDDLASALAIRRLYADFRRSLRRAVDDSPEAVLAAVRYAGGALAALVSAPDYADVRASDRTVLRRLRERALQWARHDRGAAAGLHLLDDVFTCGDLLRGINRRQELKDHDTALIAQLLRGPDDDVAAWFLRFDALFGLEDGLDSLLDRARALRRDGRALDSLVPEALVRLSQVH